MFKWLKLFQHQYLGFWILGLVLFLVQEIPYMIMPLFKMETNPIMNMQESSVLLERCEKILGFLCIALMIFVVSDQKIFFSVSTKAEKVFFALSMGVLLLNFAGWALYFAGHQTVFVMMGFIVAMPPLYYVFIGLWRDNPLLAGVGCVFFAVHFVHVLGNLKLG